MSGESCLFQISRSGGAEPGGQTDVSVFVFRSTAEVSGSAADRRRGGRQLRLGGGADFITSRDARSIIHYSAYCLAGGDFTETSPVHR